MSYTQPGNGYKVIDCLLYLPGGVEYIHAVHILGINNGSQLRVQISYMRIPHLQQGRPSIQ
jgi:hypothetical protein